MLNQDVEHKKDMSRTSSAFPLIHIERAHYLLKVPECITAEGKRGEGVGGGGVDGHINRVQDYFLRPSPVRTIDAPRQSR